jgi:hypothetical protein
VRHEALALQIQVKASATVGFAASEVATLNIFFSAAITPAQPEDSFLDPPGGRENAPATKNLAS